MDFSIDPKDRSPIYLQLEDQIRYAISVGTLRPGEHLPSIRRLEVNLGVNRHTIRKAYLDLQREGLLDIRQGRNVCVTGRPFHPRPTGATDITDAATDLASLLIQRAESEGIDALHLAERVARAACEHDARHPRFVFLECSPRQAAHFAKRAERRLERRVIGVDLHDLWRSSESIPASARFALTPHWHIAEAEELLEGSDIQTFAVSVAMTDSCIARLATLPGDTIGLVVRDAKSAPGFRAVVQRATGNRKIREFVLDEFEGGAPELVGLCSLVVTSPCADVVRSVAPASIKVEELVFDPVQSDLDALRARLFGASPAKETTG